jgi:hypothetical protein
MKTERDVIERLGLPDDVVRREDRNAPPELALLDVPHRHNDRRAKTQSSATWWAPAAR